MEQRERVYSIKRKNVNAFVFLAYLILGLYFLSFPFTEYLPYKIPDYILKFNAWIAFVGGILMLFGALNYFRVKKR